MTSKDYNGVPSWHKTRAGQDCTCHLRSIKCVVHDPELVRGGYQPRPAPCEGCRRAYESICHAGEVVTCEICNKQWQGPPIERRPSPTINLVTFVDANGKIHQNLDVFGQCMRSILDTQEKEARDALIKLGWTPPSREAGDGETFIIEWVVRHGHGAGTSSVRRPPDEWPEWVHEHMQMFVPR